MTCVFPELQLRCSEEHDSLLQAIRYLGVLTAGSILVAACRLWRKSRFMWKRSCRYARLIHLLSGAVSKFQEWQRHVLCQNCDKLKQAFPPPAALLIALCNARGKCPFLAGSGHALRFLSVLDMHHAPACHQGFSYQDCACMFTSVLANSTVCMAYDSSLYAAPTHMLWAFWSSSC